MPNDEGKKLEDGFIEYETADFYLACFLKYQGFSVSKLERQGETTRRFKFFLKGKLKDSEPSPVKLFYTGAALVDPLRFKHAIQDMKSLMHDGPEMMGQEAKQRHLNG